MPALVSETIRSDRRPRRKGVHDTRQARWVTATDLTEFHSLLALVNGSTEHVLGPRQAKEPRIRGADRLARNPVLEHPQLSGELRLQLDPASSAQYRTKSHAIYVLDEELVEPFIAAAEAFEVPEAYHAVVRAQLRAELFEDLWYREGQQTTPPPGRPATLEEITTYHRVKVRRAITDLLAAGEWIDRPEELEPEELGDLIEELNYQFRRIPLGRQNHLNYSSDAGNRRMFGKNAAEALDRSQYLNNPLVEEYVAATPEQRVGLLTVNPVLAYLLQRAGVPH